MNDQTATYITIAGGAIALISTFLVRVSLDLDDVSISENLIESGGGKIILVLGLASIIMGVLTIQGKSGLRTAKIAVGGVALALALLIIFGSMADVSDVNDLMEEDLASVGISVWLAILGSIGMLAGGIMSGKGGAEEAAPAEG